MVTKHPRIQVTLNPIEHEKIQFLAKQKKVSMSVIVKKYVEKCLENDEDEFDHILLQQGRKEITENGIISWEQVKKELGWDKL